MTVCIAAIAESGKRLILAADNMINIPIGNTINFQKEDKNHKKIYRLNENVYALAAGALHTITPVMRETEKAMGPKSSPLDVANIMRRKLQDFYLQKTEEEVLMKVNYTWDFFKNKQQQINQIILNDLYEKINKFNLDIQVIVAGYSPVVQNCYLGLVLGNGVLLEKTLEGFVTNGVGGDLARFSLVLHDYSPFLEADKLQELVKQAIIDAKKSPGVGDLGEIFIIPQSQPDKSNISPVIHVNYSLERLEQIDKEWGAAEEDRSLGP